jgi:hypothetical protein
VCVVEEIVEVGVGVVSETPLPVLAAFAVIAVVEFTYCPSDVTPISKE